MSSSLVGTLVLSAVSLCVSAAEWISVPSAPVQRGRFNDETHAMRGTSWFVRMVENPQEVTKAVWTVSGLGVFEVFVNGSRVGTDVLKPGFTHWQKTKYSFTYDVTAQMKTAKGATNAFAAEVSAGWWRDKIVNFAGKKSAFWGVLTLTYADGTEATFETESANWKCGLAGPMTHAAIFDGEWYDARIVAPYWGEGLTETPEVNNEFQGELLPTDGAEVTYRRDLAMDYGPFILKKGETKVLDFGQNCAAVPEFLASAPAGTRLTILPGEMINDADGPARGCDGPKGSVYRANLRIPRHSIRAEYIFSGKGVEEYHPRFTFFGYRYVSISATDDVKFERFTSLPVTSIKKEMELGKLTVGDPSLNRFIQNVYWGQLSNYLSVPTDCPQRNERLGWSADTQVFSEAGSFNADTHKFFKKYMRDQRDSRCRDGGFPSVAPAGQYGGETYNLGWADVGVIVPWTVWRQYNDTEIVRENWDAMVKFVKKLDETKYDYDWRPSWIYADWLSYERYETWSGWHRWRKDPGAKAFRRYLAACYWLYDARLMVEMGEAIGKTDDVAFFKASAERALEHIRRTYVEADGLLLNSMRDMQTPCVFAIRHGILEGEALEKTVDILVKSIEAHNGCLQTGFLGTSFIMDALSMAGRYDVAYNLLMQHNFPSWLYSVDQGATTVWERWNSYTKKDGFGPVGMNSFNHYAYGSVVAWMYRNMAGFANEPGTVGFKSIRLAPHADKRVGFLQASYKVSAGTLVSNWKFEGDEWIWDFTIPEGVKATVVIPGEAPVAYKPGTYHVVRPASAIDKR